MIGQASSRLHAWKRGRSTLVAFGLVFLICIPLIAFGTDVGGVTAVFAFPKSARNASSEVSAGGAANAVTINLTGSALSRMTSSPLALSPAFSPLDTDYVWYCNQEANSLALDLSSKGTISDGTQSGSNLQEQLTVVPNQAVVVTAPDGTQYWIRCLPPSFPKFSVSGAGGGGPGYYVTETFETAKSPGYPLILNSYGTPVWYLTNVPLSAQNTTLIPTTHTLSWDLASSYALYDLDTQSVSELQPPVSGFDPHELFYDTNGDAWMLSKPVESGFDLSGIGYPGVDKIEDCVVQEVNPQGQLIWEWTASNYVSPGEAIPNLTSEFNRKGGPVVDVYHCNSIDVDPLDQNDILVSMRNVGVFLIDKATGDIVWKLGGTSVAPMDGEPDLVISGDPDGGFVGQHDARFQPDGAVTLYDDRAKTSGVPRGVEYSIDTSTDTATMLWQYASPWGKGPKNNMGSVRMYDSNTLPYDQAGAAYLGDQETVINWGHGAPLGGFSIVSSTNQVLMEVRFPPRVISYRTQMVPTSALDLTELHDSAGTAFPAP